MTLLDSAKEQAKQLVARVANSAATDSGVQAITIGRPPIDVRAMFRNPDALSQIFGDIADVEAIGSDRLRWTFAGHENDDALWECIITADERQVKYIDVKPDSATEIVITVRDAPQGRGSEVVAHVSAPAPGLLTGPLTYKALYRARALLQTGEIPTIKRNPSARNSLR